MVTHSAYNRRMFGSQWFLLLLVFSSLVVVAPGYSHAQGTSKASSVPTQGEAQRALNLAESGHCTEALPLLRKAIRQVVDKDLKKRIGLDGVHCAMTHNVPYESLDFLTVLSRDFPRDPEVLYAATHAYSDLS